ncbi:MULTISPECIES: FkbM family methyltransferase [Methylosinus]|nr:MULTISPECIES: FkbM family methyltransferase [Methylosinus]
MTLIDRLKHVKRRLLGGVGRASNRKLFLFQTPRHGVDDLADIASFGDEPGTILDVGANIGQSALRFRLAFPKARIISLEPVSGTFSELQRRTADLDVDCRRLALGPEAGRATIYLTELSVTNSLKRPAAEELRGAEEIEVETLDGFVVRNGLEAIDLLKIDAEGFDLDVIRSGARTLAAGRVRFILVEVGFNPGDPRHPLFDDMRAELTPHGFRLLGFYEQNLEWSGEPRLRYANALFCRDAAVLAAERDRQARLCA